MKIKKAKFRRKLHNIILITLAALSAFNLLILPAFWMYSRISMTIVCGLSLLYLLLFALGNAERKSKA